MYFGDQLKSVGREVERLLLPLVFLVISRRESINALFGSAFGYRDNAKYLFERAVQARVPNCFWVAKTAMEYELVAGLGYPTVLVNTWSWLSCVAKAKIAFFTHGIGDVAPTVPGTTVTVNLWHGFPMKRMGYDSNRDLARIRLREKFHLGSVYSRWDYMLASNEISLRALMSATHLPRSRFLLSPQPRNRILKEARFHRGEDVALYMPTFRDDGNVDHIAQLLSWWEFVYAETGVRLCVNLHPLEATPVAFAEKNANWLVSPDDFCSSPDPQGKLAKAGYLISDYSSVIFDFLITERPIILYAPDEREYIEQRGGEFYIDYAELKKNCLAANSKSEFVNCFETNFSYEKDFLHKYSEQTEVDILEKFFAETA